MSEKLVCMLSQQMLTSNLNTYRGSKYTICIFSLSYVTVLTILLILVSLSYWHPALYLYYEDKDNKVDYKNSDNSLHSFNSNDYDSELDIKIYNDRYIDNDPKQEHYNDRLHRTTHQRKRDPSLIFIPDESEISVSEDFTEVENVPTIIQQPKNKIIPQGTEKEALSAVHLALKMKKSNKVEKALKLFRYALALQPLHSDILNHFGEFLEEKNNIIKADHLFHRALTVDPEHSRALVNRKRTLPVVNELDEKELKEIDEKQVQLIKLNRNNFALNRMKKELYFQHIYHTVSIEGNTMTLEDTRMIIETGLPVSGKSLIEHMEIVGVEAALRYINKTLVTKEVITIFDILEIHKLVLGHVKPQIAGSFRQSQVFVHKHTPPLASDVAYLMDEYVAWIQSDDFLQLHPVKQAALAHYKLVYIHPFVDGNGRTARLIMNMILMKYGYPPIIIRNSDRNHYFRTLQLANEGDIRPFIRFIAHCTECTLNAYLHSRDNIKCLLAIEPSKFEYDSDIIAL